jgi:hypothetical protein
MITLATLPQATAQQVYDQVKAHLLKQMKKSTNPIVLMECLYRGANGLKCAAGCLISDEEYSSNMENRTWKELVDKELVPADHRALINMLQEVHDCREVDEWHKGLSIVANYFKLIP